MTKLTYNLYLLYKPGPLGIIGLETDKILILAKDEFVTAEKNASKTAKILPKQREHLEQN